LILVLESIHPDAVGLLEAADEVVQTATPREEDFDTDASVRAIVTRGQGTITAATFERRPALEVVARCGVGLDNVDTAAARRSGVAVVHAPGSTTGAVVEHAVMLMLALARRVATLDAAVKAGDWAVRNGYEGVEMRGKRLGVVGLGAIGAGVAALGGALGMEVVCATRRAVTDPPRLPLEELLATSDVIQLCVPLTAETRGLIGQEQLALLRPGAILVNTARGPIVDHDALDQALRGGTLGGYAADVWDPEPPAPREGTLAHPRTLITPHVAALTDVTFREICVRPAAAVAAILDGIEPDPGCVYRGAG
jgi:phosphoglycerate dehydrogenase-like enzyme